MSNRYSLSQADGPRTTYRVIDRSRDDEIALHPATLPSGAPHQLLRWQDRYAVALVFSTSARLTLSRLVSVL